MTYYKPLTKYFARLESEAEIERRVRSAVMWVLERVNTIPIHLERQARTDCTNDIIKQGFPVFFDEEEAR